MQLSVMAPLAVVVYLIQPKIGIFAVCTLWIASIAVGAQSIISHGTSVFLNANYRLDDSYLVRITPLLLNLAA
jgi:hypothetical protein